MNKPRDLLREGPLVYSVPFQIMGMIEKVLYKKPDLASWSGNQPLVISPQAFILNKIKTGSLPIARIV